MTAHIMQGSVFDLLPVLKPGSVDAVVTSPPYWALRSYLPKDHPLKPLELGSEKTPQEYVANMVRVFGLVRTVLAEHGTVWLNIGDSYASSGLADFQAGLDEYARRLRNQKDNGAKSGMREHERARTNGAARTALTTNQPKPSAGGPPANAPSKRHALASC